MATDKLPPLGYTQQELTEADALLLHAVGEAWWVSLIGIVRRRRDSMMASFFVSTANDQRTEDVIRGQVSELNFFLALDGRGRALAEEAKKPKPKSQEG